MIVQHRVVASPSRPRNSGCLLAYHLSLRLVFDCLIVVCSSYRHPAATASAIAVSSRFQRLFFPPLDVSPTMLNCCIVHPEPSSDTDLSCSALVICLIQITTSRHYSLTLPVLGRRRSVFERWCVVIPGVWCAMCIAGSRDDRIYVCPPFSTLICAASRC